MLPTPICIGLIGASASRNGGYIYDQIGTLFIDMHVGPLSSIRLN